MSEWISVDVRLPEDDSWVIAHTKDYCTDTLVPAVYSEAGTGRWHDLDNVDADGAPKEMQCVTHWMPLPEPPQ